jgi:hypothetical protein
LISGAARDVTKVRDDESDKEAMKIRIKAAERRN